MRKGRLMKKYLVKINNTYEEIKFHEGNKKYYVELHFPLEIDKYGIMHSVYEGDSVEELKKTLKRICIEKGIEFQDEIPSK